jgi:formate dehydrogenase subunit gamma
MASLNAPHGQELRSLIAPLVHELGGPLAALHVILRQRAAIDAEAIDAVADVFNLSRAEVRGLVSFYPDFRTRTPATHVVRVCQAEACQAAGSRALTKALAERLGAGLGGASADGVVQLDAVYCLGLCARGPSAMVDGELVADADRAVDRIVERVRP